MAKHNSRHYDSRFLIHSPRQPLTAIKTLFREVEHNVREEVYFAPTPVWLIKFQQELWQRRVDTHTKIPWSVVFSSVEAAKEGGDILWAFPLSCFFCNDAATGRRWSRALRTTQVAKLRSMIWEGPTNTTFILYLTHLTFRFTYRIINNTIVLSCSLYFLLMFPRVPLVAHLVLNAWSLSLLSPHGGAGRWSFANFIVRLLAWDSVASISPLGVVAVTYSWLSPALLFYSVAIARSAYMRSQSSSPSMYNTWPADPHSDFNKSKNQHMFLHPKSRTRLTFGVFLCQTGVQHMFRHSRRRIAR